MPTACHDPSIAHTHVQPIRKLALGSEKEKSMHGVISMKGKIYELGSHPFLGYFGKSGFQIRRFGQNETCATHFATRLDMVRPSYHLILTSEPQTRLVYFIESAKLWNQKTCYKKTMPNHTTRILVINKYVQYHGTPSSMCLSTRMHMWFLIHIHPTPHMYNGKLKISSYTYYTLYTRGTIQYAQQWYLIPVFAILCGCATCHASTLAP